MICCWCCSGGAVGTFHFNTTTTHACTHARDLSVLILHASCAYTASKQASRRVYTMHFPLYSRHFRRVEVSSSMTLLHCHTTCYIKRCLHARTCIAYMYAIPVRSTCCNYVYTCVPVRNTGIAYRYAIPVRNTCLQFVYTCVPVLRTCMRMHIIEQGGVANDDVV